MSDIKTLHDPKERYDTIHELKTWRGYYSQVLYDFKTFEVRKNDRDFKEGDWLKLREWDNQLGEYTGQFLYRRIGYILHGGQFGIEKGYVVMQLKKGVGPIKIEVKY